MDNKGPAWSRALVVLAWIMALSLATPTVEVGCVRREGQRIACASLVQKLAVYAGDFSIKETAADNGNVADDTVFRVTLLEKANVCVVEIIAVLEQTPARTASFACEDERRLALHIKGELDGGFEEAVRALRAGARRLKQVESALTKPQPVIALPAESTKAEPTKVEPAPRVSEVIKPSAVPASLAAPALRFGLSASGGVSGLGDLVAGGGGVAVTGRFSLPIEISLGLRVASRPPQDTPRGALAATFIQPFVRASYCFSPWRFELCAGVSVEAFVGVLRLAEFDQTLLATGGAGGVASLRYPLHPRASFYVETRVLGLFHRPQLLSASTVLFSPVPVSWGGDVGLLFWL